MNAVILTKSYKKDQNNHSGWCVVAFDLDNRKLVRFVDKGGAAIPKKDLDQKGIQVMNKVSVTVLQALPQGPQTENLLVDPSSFKRLGKYTPGIGGIMKMIAELPEDEPRFMNDCEYKYMDISRFHHSIEFINARNLKSWIHPYADPKSARLSQFDTDAGHHEAVRITVPSHYRLNYDWEYGNAIAVVTISAEPWMKNDTNYGYFKFVAALYEMPPAEEK